MLWFDWVLTLVVIGVFALAGRPLQLIAKRAHAPDRMRRKSRSGTLTALLMETFSARAVRENLRLEDRETDRANGAFEERAASSHEARLQPRAARCR